MNGGVVGRVGAIVVVFEDWCFELEKAKFSPRPTPVDSNIIDNNARINLLTTKRTGIEFHT